MNSFCSFSFGTLKIEDSLLIGVYGENTIIDLDEAKEIVQYRLSFQNGNEYPFLGDVRQVKYISKEARDYFAKEGVKGMTALAILVENLVSAIIANIFITFSKPVVPTKAFKNEEEALSWLNQFKCSAVSLP